MPTDIIMPRLSDSMEEGTILAWMKAVGDEVAVGDELVEIETDKANMVFEADAAGTLIEILAADGQTVSVGAPIARVGERGEAPAATGGPARVNASPVARRIAAERDLDLGGVSGSGPGGRIVKADVEQTLASGSVSTPSAAVPSPAQAGSSLPGSAGAADMAPGAPPTAPASAGDSRGAKGPVEVVELTKLQGAVARRMAESKATAPHFYLEARIDMSRCVAARARLKERAPDATAVPSVNDMVVKASALALREFPRANGSYREGRWELYSRVNVGVAVAVEGALVVPTIFDADSKRLGLIAAESRRLAERVRNSEITPPELSGATFTVSNLGMYGVSSFHPVINSPQAAILAVGEIVETPVIRSGEATTAMLMSATLACDHRILYGADAAEFLARIKDLLSEPIGLAL